MHFLFWGIFFVVLIVDFNIFVPQSSMCIKVTWTWTEFAPSRPCTAGQITILLIQPFSSSIIHFGWRPVEIIFCRNMATSLNFFFFRRMQPDRNEFWILMTLQTNTFNLLTTLKVCEPSVPQSSFTQEDLLFELSKVKLFQIAIVTRRLWYCRGMWTWFALREQPAAET